MSEIKGQLLGILLVLAVFGAVAGALLGAFQKASKNVADKIEESPTIQAPSNVQSMMANDVQLLTF